MEFSAKDKKPFAQITKILVKGHEASSSGKENENKNVNNKTKDNQEDDLK